MDVLVQLLTVVLSVFWLVLVFRLVMEYVFQFARSYQPRGVMLVAVETTYTVTDPPLRLLRRYLRPLRLGGFALDLSFLVLMIIVWLLLTQVVPRL